MQLRTAALQVLCHCQLLTYRYTLVVLKSTEGVIHLNTQPPSITHFTNSKLLQGVLKNYIPVFIFVFSNLDTPYRGDHLS